MEIRNILISENWDTTCEVISSGNEWDNYQNKSKLQENPAASASELLLHDLTYEIYRSHGYMPITKPAVNSCVSDASQCCLKCSFVIFPVISHLQYIGLQVDRPVKKVNDEEIDEAVKSYMKEHLYVHHVEREARIGDIVEVKFRGTHNGGRFPYDHSDHVRFLLGSDKLFYGLDQALVNHVGGDELNLTLTMPDDFHREAIRGMTLDLTIHLTGVWARDLLECTDSYVQEKIPGCSSIADFRQKLAKDIQKKYDTFSDIIYEKNFETALANTVTCQIPKCMTDAYIQKYTERIKKDALSEGKTFEQSLEESGMNENSFYDYVLPIAQQQAKLSIVIDYIIQNEKITVTDDFVRQQVQKRAAQAGISFQSALEKLGGEEHFTEEILSRTAYNLVKKNAVMIDYAVENFDSFHI